MVMSSAAREASPPDGLAQAAATSAKPVRRAVTRMGVLRSMYGKRDRRDPDSQLLSFRHFAVDE